MGVDKDLDVLEDGYETEAEQIDEETEIGDVESFLDDEVMDPASLETDLEDAYNGFTANKDGETVAESRTHDRLASIVEDEVGLDLSEEGFHVEGPEGRSSARNLADEGAIDDYDVDELTDDVEEVTEDEPDDSDYGYDVYEMELDDDDIAYYIVDEDDNEIGFAIIEDGEEVEYYYVTDDDEDDEILGEKEIAAAEAADDDFAHKKSKKKKSDEAEYDFGITREGVAEATSDMNTIYKEGAQTVAELKGAYDDIKSALDFKSLFKK